MTFIKKSSKIVTIVALVLVLFVAMFASINALAAAPVLDAYAAPSAATAAVVDTLTKVGVTTTQYGTYIDLRPYDNGQCFLDTAFDATAGASQTLTILFQEAAVPGKWVTSGYSLQATTTTVTSTARNNVGGAYGRVYATVATTTWPVSYSVKCVMR
jgi:hypothetical protein